MKTHGKTGTPEFEAWCGMRRRCTNPNHKNYDQYGGRGIEVCERWLNSFQNFIEDMGERPSPKHSIERIDNDGNYEPTNCCWATRSEQNQNRRNAYSKAEDEKIKEAISFGYSFSQMAAHVGRSYASVMMRTYRLGLRSGRPSIGLER